MYFTKLIALILVVLVAALGIGALVERHLDEAARRQFAGGADAYLTLPDGSRVRVRRSVPPTGAPEKPLVVFETGLGGTSLEWHWIQAGIASAAPTMAYDRSGIGWSDAASNASNAATAAKRLHALLEMVGTPSGVLLVAHSLGGSHAAMFRHLYPELVRGMVLVDPVHPDQMTRLPQVDVDGDRHFFKRIKLAAFLSRFGAMRLFSLWDGPGAELGEGAAVESAAMQASHRHLAAVAEEVDAWDASLADMRAAPLTTPMPLTILSSSLPATDGTRQFQELHNELVGSVPDAEHIVVENADHQSLLRQQVHAAATVDAIRRMLSRL